MNKQIKAVVGIIIILLFAGVVGASVLLLSQEGEEVVLLEEDVEYEEDIMGVDEEITEKHLEDVTFSFCEEQNLEAGVSLLVAFSKPGIETDILFTCGEGEYGGYQTLFVINDKGDILLKREKDPEESKRSFEDIEAIDVNEDGMSEIIYEETSWSLSHSDKKKYLYSPAKEEWFFVSDKEILNPSEESHEIICERTITYSENTKEEKFSPYKSFLKIEDTGECVKLDY